MKFDRQCDRLVFQEQHFFDYSLEAVMRTRFVLLSLMLLAACGRASDITGPNPMAKEASVARFIAPPSFRSNLVVVTPGSTVPSPSGLRACYAGEGNAAEVVSKQNGIVGSGVTFSAGRFGQAFDFSALGQRVDIPASSTMDVGAGGGLTFSAWFFGRGSAFGVPAGNLFGAGPLMEFDSGAQLWQHYQFQDDNGIFTNLATSSNDQTSHILQYAHVSPWGQWNHAAVTYDKASGSASLYINGVVAGSAALGSYSPNTTTMMHIGGRIVGSFGSQTFTFNGAIDEVQLYDRALSPSEIGQLYNATGTMCVAPATQYVVQTFPAGGGESGVPFTTQPVVLLKDADGNVVSNSIAPVTATIVSGTGTLLGTTTVNAVAGVATFTNLAIAGAGTVTIKFTAGSLPPAAGTSSTSTPITSVQVPRNIGIVTQPGGGASALALTPQPVLQILDAANLLIPGATNAVTAAIASGTGTLGGTKTVNAVNGIVTFSGLNVTGAGTYTLSFTGTGLATATSGSVAVTPTAPTQLVVTTQPVGNESGLALSTQPVVELRDAAGVLASTSTVAVTASLISSTGTLIGTTTVNAVGGVATFTDLKINGSGAASISFSAAPSPGYPPITLASANSITVAQVPHSLAITQQPSIGTSGTAMTPWKIEVRDAANLKIANATIAIKATVSQGTGTLAGTATQSAVAGVATFGDLAIAGTGGFTLSFGATDPLYASLVVVSQPLLLSATQSVASMAITVQPAGALSGAAFTTQPVLEIRDAAGNKVSTANNAVTVSIASGTGTLSGTTTVSAVNGVVTFTNLTLSSTGAVTLKFTSSGLVDVTSSSLTVTSPVGPATKLGIVTQPAGAETGVAFTTQPTIEVLDANGNRATSFTGTVTATSTGDDRLYGTTTATVVNGVATFTGLKFNNGGAHTIKFIVSGLSSVTSASFLTIDIARALVITDAPRSGKSGATLDSYEIEIRNAVGDRMSVSNANITAAIANGAGGTLGGTLTEQSSRGKIEFDNLKITGAGGSYTLTFTYGALSVTSTALSITAVVQTPDHLTIVTQPSGATSGLAFATQPRVEIRDRNDNKILTVTTAVTVSISSGSGVLTGTKTVNAVNGVAIFTDLKLTGVGSDKLKFSASGNIDSDLSKSITVAAPPVSISWGSFGGDISSQTGLNRATAGRDVNVEFNIGGDKGSAIFAKNYPASRPVSCSTLAAAGALVALDGGHDDDEDHDHWWNDDHRRSSSDGWNSHDDDDNGFSLAYSNRTGRYSFTWNTSRQYAGTCRSLVLMFTDGTTKTAYFQF
jgi:hypothetical protein